MGHGYWPMAEALDDEGCCDCLTLHDCMMQEGRGWPVSHGLGVAKFRCSGLWWSHPLIYLVSGGITPEMGGWRDWFSV